MEALRKIITSSEDSIIVDRPPAFRHRKLEVLVVPMEDSDGNSKPPTWPPDFFTDVAGAWAGEPLLCEPEGDAESRRKLD